MNETLSRVQRRERPLATGGVAVYFATEFDGRFGDRAAGPFEVSADRYDVTVHRAMLRTQDEIDAFQEAMIRAKAAHLAARGGWGEREEGSTPRGVSGADTLTLALRIIAGMEGDSALLCYWEDFFLKPRPERSESEGALEYRARITYEIRSAACRFVAMRVEEAGRRG